MLGKDSKDPENAGGYPWTVAGDQQSTLLLYNHSAGAAKVVVHVDATDELWQKTYTLGGGESRQFSINKLMRNGVKDDLGKTVPTSVQSGLFTGPRTSRRW